MNRGIRFFNRMSLWITFIIGMALVLFSSIAILYYRKIFPGGMGNLLEIISVVVLAIAGIWFMIKIYPKFMKTGYKTTICLFGLIVVAQILFLIFVSHPMSTSDAAQVQGEAFQMVQVQHGKINPQNAYFQRYSNNYFVTVLFYLFFKLLDWCNIHQVAIPLTVLNTCLWDVGIYLSFRIISKIKGKGVANSALFCCLLCPTTYVWLTTAYTNTMSFPFIMGILYLYLKLQCSNTTFRHIINSALLGGCMAIGYWLRPTTIIPIIALIIACFVQEFKRKTNDRKKIKAQNTYRDNVLYKIKSRKILLLQMFIVLLVFGSLFVGCAQLVNRHVDKKQFSGNFPITHWIMMGLNEKSHGEYSRKDEKFTEQFASKKQKAMETTDIIKQRIKQMNPVRLGKHLLVKLFRVWAMGDDDSLPKAQYAKDFPLLYEYVMGSNNGSFLWYMQAFRICMFLLMSISFFAQLNTKNGSPLFVFSLTFLGAVLFFLLWEANRKYNVCFMGVCLVLAIDGLDNCMRFLTQWKSKYVRPVWRVSYKSLISICIMGVFVTQALVWKQEYRLKEQLFYQCRSEGDSISLDKKIILDTQCIEQTLQQNQSIQQRQWNQILLYFAKPHMKTKQNIKSSQKEYKIELLTQDRKKVLYENEIGAADLNSDHAVVIDFEGQKGVSGYLLRLTYIGNSVRYLVPKVGSYPYFDCYPYGKMYLDQQETPYDLAMSLRWTGLGEKE